MTQLLERAYAEVEQLTEPDQGAIAALILEELEGERRCQRSFARSTRVNCLVEPAPGEKDRHSKCRPTLE